MKIKEIKIYKIDLPMKEGSYSWAKQSFSSFDSTVVTIKTDTGLIGVGETCPLGPSYLPAFAEGARAAIQVISPKIIGLDPTDVNKINYEMDLALNGHPYAKSAIDMACWDLFGKITKMPVYKLLGGMQNKKIKLFKVVSRRDPDEMAKNIVDYQKQGFKQFQMKVGADPYEDIERIEKVSSELVQGNILNADANCGWLQHEAMVVINASKDKNLYLEQPCSSYNECLSIRRKCSQPFILDECMTNIEMLLKGINDNAMDAVNLKINRIGGITKSKLFRDVCINFGVMMTIEDAWGGEIATSAIAHLAHSTPKEFHFQSSAFHEYTDVVNGIGGPELKEGYMFASDSPGLGVEPNYDSLGNPLFEISG